VQAVGPAEAEAGPEAGVAPAAEVEAAEAAEAAAAPAEPSPQPDSVIPLRSHIDLDSARLGT
jgi:hypothetical protein